MSEHSAAWMRAGSSIEIADGVGPDEPTPFVVPDYMALTSFIERIPEALLHHRLGVKRVTATRLVLPPPAAGRSLAIQEVARLPGLTVVDGPSALVEFTFDDQPNGATIDARPELPLVIGY